MKKLSCTFSIILLINVVTKAQVCFSPMKVFKPIGRQAIAAASVTNADFNGDGKIDLATTNQFINQAGTYDFSNVSILLGNGSGNFTTVPDTFYVAYGASQVISADFNNDGKVDLATNNFIPGNINYIGSVSILLGTGTGGFTPRTDFLSGNRPSSITSADFNGDGFADFATSNPDVEQVYVSLGNGTGNFSAAQSFMVGGHAWSIISTDFNNDGKIDLATANGDSNNVSVLLGMGNGSFAAANTFSVGITSWWRDTNEANPNGGMANSIRSADFNNDGKQDIVVVHNDSNIVSVLLGNGNGSFGALTNYSIGAWGSPFQVIIADYNGDGNADLATANAYNNVFGSQNPYIPGLVVVNNTISVMLGNGAGSFGAPTSFTVGNGPQWATSADFNTDGKADVAVIDTAVSVLLNCDLLGIQQLSNNKGLHVYPNPSNGIMYIEVENDNIPNANYQIHVTNVLGQIVFQSGEQETANAIIDLSAQPNGIYFINLQTEGKQYTQKVIKN